MRCAEGGANARRSRIRPAKREQRDEQQNAFLQPVHPLRVRRRQEHRQILVAVCARAVAAAAVAADHVSAENSGHRVEAYFEAASKGTSRLI